MLAIYCRTSKSKKEGQDQSIPSQKMLGVKFSEKKGWDYEFFVDEGISGTGDDIKDRPQFAEMINLIRKGKVNAVYCFDQSRIERNTEIWNFFAGILLKAKCEYYPGGKFFDLDVPENKLFSGLVSLTNSFYASLTSKKTKLADALNAQDGKTHGMTAYGYQRGDKGYYQINNKEAEVVNKIFSLSLDGIGAYTIANILNKEGVQTKFNRFEGKISRKDKITDHISVYDKEKVKWRGTVVYDMLRNPIYKGIRKWNELEIKIPAIIEADLWDKTNKNIVKNKKNVGRKNDYHYLLNGIMFCGNCGMEFRGKKRLKGNDRAYKCKGVRQPNPTCSESRGINIPKIETFIIKHLFESKGLRDFLTNISVDTNETDNLKQQLDKKRKSLTRIDATISRAYKLLIDPDFEDDSVIKEELKKSKNTKESLVEDITALENKIVLNESDNRKNRVKQLIDGFNINTDFESIRQAVHSLVDKITVEHTKKDKTGYYTIKINYKNFIEESIFVTDYQSFKWLWLSQSIEYATNTEELQDDIDLANYLCIKNGENRSMTELDPNFKGFETFSSEHEIIKFTKDELIHFD
jgi:site-specific DNA recombinase